MIKKVLILTFVFRPNVGGAETYANELTEALRKRNYFVYVLTYQPISGNQKGESLEKGKNLEIRRFQWIGDNWFHKLEKYPLFLFAYITPYLFIRSFWWMLWNHKKIDVIDAQGLNSSFIAVIFRYLFRKRAVASIMSLYDFQPGSLFARVVSWTLSRADHVIAESEASKKELVGIGIPENKITTFVEWVDLDMFKPLNKKLAKRNLNLPSNFIVLFVARAIKIKGADIVIDASKRLQKMDITFVFISRDGPMVDVLRNESKNSRNILFIEGMEYEKLREYYAAADVFVIPSRYSENAARTVVESFACGTPVIGSNLGAIPSLMDKSVGFLVNPEPVEIGNAIKKLYHDKVLLNQMTKSSRLYALKKFSEKNVTAIVNCY
ncbi:hypothetical protein A3D77_04385 [Candidatus Gottesmanbacteria bacterium RIFCSPHIGHO2_02_FULL_39_11]|uniref:Glycosyltransferase subfamily 4-like N-terminal domain-containing protein n=1 Tax=Candidatus Gottesmanbacteria bacterium RIFCSPHIGHO2_02_FULL_39_11 TaxID=1798382 RepID=A0A1F5ZJH8_9BACT|nr:MAG: hypothetical protein A3D77_04385 [Candidatus Gottesmanbacteria bacterium RIFCSPHIGHO2_02_FULL_39_11]